MMKAQLKIFSIALGIVLMQLLLSLVLTPPGNLNTIRFNTYPEQWITNPPDFHGWGRYRRLNHWDSFHYLSIAEFGYRLGAQEPESSRIHKYQDNTAFFPGFPMVSRLVQRVFSVPMDVALLMAAHFFDWVTWVYFLLILKRFQVSGKTGVFAVWIAMSFPTSFYLTMGYSESLFMATLLGFLYEYTAVRSLNVFSILYGFVMTSTRVVGIPLSILPLVMDRFVLNKKNLVTLLGISGGWFSFFAYCQWIFGRWDLYFLTGKIGWNLGVHQSEGILKWLFYTVWREQHLVPLLSCIFLFFFLVAFVLLGIELSKKKDFKNKELSIGLLYSSLVIYGLSFLGTYSIHLVSFIRYCLPCFYFCVLLTVGLTDVFDKLSVYWKILIFLLTVGGFILQRNFIFWELNGYFIA